MFAILFQRLIAVVDAVWVWAQFDGIAPPAPSAPPPALRKPGRVYEAPPAPPALHAPVKLYTKDAPARAMGLSGVKQTPTGPRGWLGFLASHGAASFAYELLYISKQVYAISPRIKATWHTAKSGYVELNHSDVDCLSRRCAEIQSPLWGTGYAPGPACAPVKSPKFADDDMVNIINGVSEGNGLSGVESRVRWRDYRGGPIGRSPAANIARHWDNIRAKDATHEGRICDGARAWLASHAGKTIRCPSWWQGASLQKEFELRIVRWYDNAQFLVWSCEMARLHSGAAVYLPPWWIEYANSWGIAVAPPGLAITRKRYNTNTVYTEHRDIKNAVAGVGLPRVSAVEWEVIARALEKATSKPGDAQFMGSQIRPPSSKRHILDLPDGALSLVPSMRKDGELYAGFLSKWCQRQSFREAVLVAWGVVQKVFNLVIAAFGGAAVAAAFSAMQAAYAGACSILQAVSSLANGGDVAEGVYDVVSGIAVCVSAVGEATGRDVAEMIPDDAWAALTTVGAAIPEWGGEMVELVQQDAIMLQTNLTTMRDVYHWPYLEEGFSCLVGGRD